MRGCLSLIAGMGLVAMLAAGGFHYLRVHRLAPIRSVLLNRQSRLFSPGAKQDGGEEHFSPAENLERIELSELRSAAERARGSNTPLRIAIYAFTNRALAQLLVDEADRGAIVEIYRDGEQYEMEEQNGERFHDGSVTSLFRGHSNIHVRVKPPSRSDLMHLKAWSDGEVLREGSANWSPAALKRQDNNVRFSRNPTEVKAFEEDFKVMWNRASNTVVQ